MSCRIRLFDIGDVNYFIRNNNCFSVHVLFKYENDICYRASIENSSENCIWSIFKSYIDLDDDMWHLLGGMSDLKPQVDSNRIDSSVKELSASIKIDRQSFWFSEENAIKRIFSFLFDSELASYVLSKSDDNFRNAYNLQLDEFHEFHWSAVNITRDISDMPSRSESEIGKKDWWESCDLENASIKWIREE